MRLAQQNVGEDLPNTIHKTIGHNKTKDRVVIVGDVHGCLDEFKELIQKVNYDESSDVLLLTGLPRPLSITAAGLFM